MVAALLLSAYALFAFIPATKYDLRFNLEKGKNYLYSTSANQSINQEVNGQKMDVNQSFGFDYLFEVQQKDKQGNTTINVRCDRILVKMSNPMMNVEYNSANPSPDLSNPMVKVFAAMKGESVLAMINAQGIVTSVQGTDKLINSMAAKIAEKDTAKLASTKEVLARQFGEAMQKSSLESLTRVYPATKVGIGDSWTITTEQNAVVPTKSDNMYKLVSVSGEIAKIAVDGKTTSNGTGTVGQTNLSGDQHGELEMNIKTGLVLKSTITQKLTGTIETQGMKIPIQIGTTISLSGKGL